uniref:Putative reverse transcriptase n=1 Tax=Ixodes scapularis TaxID=6945 RepID=A0A4D5RB90_IXOSC
MAVVCEILLWCGFWYVGQTGRCLNGRLLEHKRTVNSSSVNYEIVNHLNECNNCYSDRAETTVVSKEKYSFKGVIKEAIRITTAENCISRPSLTLD